VSWAILLVDIMFLCNILQEIGSEVVERKRDLIGSSNNQRSQPWTVGPVTDHRWSLVGRGQKVGFLYSNHGVTRRTVGGVMDRAGHPSFGTKAPFWGGKSPMNKYGLTSMTYGPSTSLRAVSPGLVVCCSFDSFWVQVWVL